MWHSPPSCHHTITSISAVIALIPCSFPLSNLSSLWSHRCPRTVTPILEGLFPSRRPANQNHGQVARRSRPLGFGRGLTPPPPRPHWLFAAGHLGVGGGGGGLGRGGSGRGDLGEGGPKPKCCLITGSSLSHHTITLNLTQPLEVAGSAIPAMLVNLNKTFKFLVCYIIG